MTRFAVAGEQQIGGHTEEKTPRHYQHALSMHALLLFTVRHAGFSSSGRFLNIRYLYGWAPFLSTAHIGSPRRCAADEGNTAVQYIPFVPGYEARPTITHRQCLASEWQLTRVVNMEANHVGKSYLSRSSYSKQGHIPMSPFHVSICVRSATRVGIPDIADDTSGTAVWKHEEYEWLPSVDMVHYSSCVLLLD